MGLCEGETLPARQLCTKDYACRRRAEANRLLHRDEGTTSTAPHETGFRHLGQRHLRTVLLSHVISQVPVSSGATRTGARVKKQNETPDPIFVGEKSQVRASV